MRREMKEEGEGRKQREKKEEKVARHNWMGEDSKAVDPGHVNWVGTPSGRIDREFPSVGSPVEPGLGSKLTLRHGGKLPTETTRQKRKDKRKLTTRS